jgi:hypothetical protein
MNYGYADFNPGLHGKSADVSTLLEISSQIARQQRISSGKTGAPLLDACNCMRWPIIPETIRMKEYWNHYEEHEWTPNCGRMESLLSSFEERPEARTIQIMKTGLNRDFVIGLFCDRQSSSRSTRNEQWNR